MAQLALFDEIEVIHTSPEHEQVDSWIDYCNNVKDLTGNKPW
nr:MAG TPA: hypothetical protein [Caudoviricetes sp.]